MAISDRHFGVGSDGLILVGPSEVADARMRMFNADGSEAEMCGNGVRCVAKLVYDRGIARKPSVTIETGRGVLGIDLTIEGAVATAARVNMGWPIMTAAEIPTTPPGDPPIDAPIAVGGREFRVTCASIGNPHAVIYVEDVAAVPLETLGPALERHEAFPRRANIHFVEVLGREEARMRTWERGSGITMACGTGACAVAVAGGLDREDRTTAPGPLPGGPLTLEWPSDEGVGIHDRAGDRSLPRRVARLNSDGSR